MEAIVLVDFKDKPTGVKYKVGDNYKGDKARIDFLVGLNFVAAEFVVAEQPKVKVKKTKK